MAITISGSNDNISAADGSLTIEGLTASGDLSVDSVTVGTGASVSSPSANTLALGTNDSERVRVDSSGRVGVGTNSPTTVTQFQVLGTSAGNTATFGGINQGTSGRVGGIILGTDTDNSSRRLWGIRGEASVAGQMGIFYSSDNVTTPFSGTQTVSLTSGGNVKIENGNLVFSTSGTGIDFSAASGSAAGSTSALLDDYEEGTFTPSFTGSTTNPTITYLNQLGRYTKIGNVCFIEIRMVTSNVSGGGGNLKISGLPFSQSPNSNLGGAFTKGFVYQWAQDPETFITFSGDSTIGIYRNDSTNTIAQVSDLTSGAVNNYLNISGSYITA